MLTTAKRDKEEGDPEDESDGDAPDEDEAEEGAETPSPVRPRSPRVSMRPRSIGTRAPPSSFPEGDGRGDYLRITPSRAR